MSRLHKHLRNAVFAVPLLVLATPVSAAPMLPALDQPAMAMPVAEGCGWGRWRGPWGGCRGPGPGPAPGWAWRDPAYAGGYGGNGCPPGYWRGPWGHCRDTPYHGRLPNGGWQ